MTETRLNPIRLTGWKRTALPGAVTTLFGTPMLWALGTFDGTAEPLRHAAIFGISGILLFSFTPWCAGWALQGFVQRQKPDHDPRDEMQQPAPHRPGVSHAARHP